MDCSKEKYIRLILEGDPMCYAAIVFGIRTVTPDVISDIYEVTKSDIIDYIKTNGFPKQYFRPASSKADGLYFHQINSKWVFYNKKDGEVTYNLVSNTYEDGIVPILNYVFDKKGIRLR